MIRQLKLRMSNAYLLLGTRPILVDSGSRGDLNAIRKALREWNVEFTDLALLIHTHVHSDHFGNTAAIAAEAKCPIAYHRADQPLIQRANNGKLSGVGLRGKTMARVFSKAPFSPVNADWFAKDGMSLAEFGCNAKIVESPGHTAGSISIITPEGDGIIGDVIMGGWMGGLLRPYSPNYHYFADDLPLAMQSLDLVLKQTAGRLFVGHGGPLHHARVQQWRRKT